MITLFLACTEGDWQTLLPYDNPMPESDPMWSPQPARDKPTEVVVHANHAYVTLPGQVDEPGCEVADVDLGTGEISRLEVGPSPAGVAVHPDGWLLVTNRYANWTTQLFPDTGESRRLATDFYATEVAFAPGGAEAWVTNRWMDRVEVWDFDGAERVGVSYLSAGVNPRDVAVSDTRVAVANLTGLTVDIYDRQARAHLASLDLGAPPNGLAFAGDWLVVATLSASRHNLPHEGADSDGDGEPGDGTPNVNFQDLQSEIAVIDARDGTLAHRYTSDTMCCRDYRDVHPDDTALYGDELPSRDTWIVGGALPEQVLVDGQTVWVGYSASNQLQAFEIDPSTGALSPGAVSETGHGPHGLALTEHGDVLVVERLAETLARFRLGTLVDRFAVGDTRDGPFPSTDAEIGELFNQVTAPFTVDGDQACVMCHREGGNINKAVGMPLARHAGVNARMVAAYRGAYDTRPWFFEGAMDETNFRPVINEFARAENFCCEDYTLFPSGAPADCATNPPDACFSEPNAGSVDGFQPSRDTTFLSSRPTAFVTRDAFFLDAASRLVGRDTTFGDAVYAEDPLTLERQPLSLGFEGITRALGAFLLRRPQLPPNPNDPDTTLVRRGEALFSSPAVGCAACHPAPAFAVSTLYNPSGLPMVMPPVVSPFRDPGGTNLDLLSDGFIATFPTAEQDTCEEICGADVCDENPFACDDLMDVRMNPPQLRGAWDRAPRMLHDGRAQGLREVLCTPGHPALRDGERGFNEHDGIPDSHGATSHLPADDIEALIAYIESL